MNRAGTRAAADTSLLDAIVRKYGALLRAVPALKPHPSGQAAVSYRVAGRRAWAYFGKVTDPAAAARYRAWAARWPEQLDDPAPARWRQPRLLTHDGRTQSLSAWAKEVGLTGSCIRWRLGHGWTVARALTTPPFTRKSAFPQPVA